MTPTGSLTATQTITHLLDHWHLITDPAPTLRDSAADPDGSPHMPEIYWHPVVRELERCLTQLRAGDPTTYAHLRAYYDAPTKIVRTTHTRRKPNGRLETIKTTERQRILPPNHRTSLLSHGIQWITDHYHGTPEIPRLYPFVSP